MLFHCNELDMETAPGGRRSRTRRAVPLSAGLSGPGEAQGIPHAPRCPGLVCVPLPDRSWLSGPPSFYFLFVC